MPRNGSGSMSVPNTFSPNTTAQSTPVNANFTDVASELTNSLPRDGQAGMTGQFKAANGTALAPGISFGSDTNSGLYRNAGDSIGVSAGGTNVGNFDSTGFTGNVSGTVTGEVSGPITYLPAGTTMLFYQASVPTGWSSVSGLNEHAIRVVNNSNGGSTAGTRNFSSVFGDVTIFKSNLPDYNLSAGSLSISNNTSVARNVSVSTTGSQNGPGTVVAGVSFTSSTLNITGNVPSGGSGNALDFNVKYADMVMGQKD